MYLMLTRFCLSLFFHPPCAIMVSKSQAKLEISLRFGSLRFSPEKLRDDAIWLQVWLCLSRERHNHHSAHAELRYASPLRRHKGRCEESSTWQSPIKREILTSPQRGFSGWQKRIGRLLCCPGGIHQTRTLQALLVWWIPLLCSCRASSIPFVIIE